MVFFILLSQEDVCIQFSDISKVHDWNYCFMHKTKSYKSIYLYVLQILILLIVPRTAQYHVFFFYDILY